MERQLRKQIDDLLDYTIYLKKMYTKIAQSEAYPDGMIEEDRKEIKDILSIMNAALEIEAKKISKIHMYTSDIDAIEAYLLKNYEYTAYEDFVFEENELERVRVYNKLLYKFLSERKYKETFSIEELVTYSFSKIVDSNFVYILNNHMKNPEVINLFGFLKYGKIFISPTYDFNYFPNLQVSDLKSINQCPILAYKNQKNYLTTYALEEINEEFKSIIDNLYNGFTNEALENDENEIRVVAMIMTIVTFLSTSSDPKFIDERYIEFIRSKKEDKEYSNVNDMILSSLVESKRIVLKQQEKRN